MSSSAQQPIEPDPTLDAQLTALGKQLRSRSSIKQHVMRRLAQESTANRPNHPPAISKPIKSGELSMFQKLSCGSIAASLLLAGAFVVSNSVLVKHSLADVIANVREVTSYQAKMRIETQLETGKPPVQQTGTIYWKAPGSHRMDSSVKMPGRKSETKTINICFPDKPGIELNIPNKTFRPLPAAAGARSPLMAMQQLAKYRGDTAKDLGSKRIDAVDCYGFAISLHEVDENILDGTMQVWVDKQTDLPIEIRMNVFPGASMVTYGFEWNKQFDDNTFETTAPEGFTEKANPKSVSDEEIAEHIVAALGNYAALSGGKYPPVKVIYGDIIAAQLRKLVGIKGPPFDAEVLKSKAFQQVMECNRGFAHMTVMMRESSAAKYFGKTIGPSDKQAILFQWKRADGKLHCIYGDLSTAVK